MRSWRKEQGREQLALVRALAFNDTSSVIPRGVTYSRQGEATVGWAVWLHWVGVPGGAISRLSRVPSHWGWLLSGRIILCGDQLCGITCNFTLLLAS